MSVAFSHAHATPEDARQRLSVSLRLPSLHLRLAPPQLGMLCAAADYLSTPDRFELWRRHRPHGGRPHAGKRGAAARWWRAAIGAVVEQVRRSCPPFNWAVLLRRREQRKRYVALYAARLKHARGGRRVAEADRAALQAR